MKTTTKLTSLALLSALSCSVASAALTTTTTYDGIGAVDDATNWDNSLPTNANPGLVSGTDSADSAWLGPVWTNVAIRQTGGTMYAAGTGNFNMRGGALNSGNTTILEIDDAANTSFASKNLDVSGTFSMWSQNAGGGGQELSVLSGYADVGNLNAVSSATTSIINIGNGKLDIGTLTAARVGVNMLSGGTGEIVLDDRNGSLLNSMRLNFASDSSASFTILQNGGASSSGYWEFYVGAGFASIDGLTVTDLSQFDIQDVGGTGTMISAIPEPSSAALLFGVVSFGWLALRRR